MTLKFHSVAKACIGAIVVLKNYLGSNEMSDWKIRVPCATDKIGQLVYEANWWLRLSVADLQAGFFRYHE